MARAGLISMLELRLTADAKRIASMRDAIRAECERTHAGTDHAVAISRVVEGLLDADETQPGRRARRARRQKDLFVIVTVQSDATMLLVRDTRPGAGLGARRQRVLEEHTSSWSTMAGPDGRTVWAEIARAAAPEPVRSQAECARAAARALSAQATATRSPRSIAPPVVINA